MKRAFLMQPTIGLDKHEVQAKRTKAIEELKEEGYSVTNEHYVDLTLSANVSKAQIRKLAEELEDLSNSDILYACSNWYRETTNQVIHKIAREHHYEIKYEGVKNDK